MVNQIHLGFTLTPLDLRFLHAEFHLPDMTLLSYAMSGTTPLIIWPELELGLSLNVWR